jgi:hypothetical protein
MAIRNLPYIQLRPSRLVYHIPSHLWVLVVSAVDHACHYAPSPSNRDLSPERRRVYGPRRQRCPSPLPRTAAARPPLSSAAACPLPISKRRQEPPGRREPSQGAAGTPRTAASPPPVCEEPSGWRALAFPSAGCCVISFLYQCGTLLLFLYCSWQTKYMVISFAIVLSRPNYLHAEMWKCLSW